MISFASYGTPARSGRIARSCGVRPRAIEPGHVPSQRGRLRAAAPTVPQADPGGRTVAMNSTASS